MGAKYVGLIPVGGDVVGWIQEDITDSVLKKAEKDTSGEARLESSMGYSESEGAAKKAAAKAVETVGKAAGLTPEQYRDYQGYASTQTATAHSVGRDLVASSHPRGH
ncbi:hypothetical protein [Streptomyces sp. NRRL WC-3549]|uniref:hypothetical protein n=1 Tax=Streptomyces sp. NRRL WC-3549 TaxID=1463925 RepID=UPI0004CB13A1|nr:hypothetical protein [Streptomyces sp. NRRL WC-3549]